MTPISPPSKRPRKRHRLIIRSLFLLVAVAGCRGESAETAASKAGDRAAPAAAKSVNLKQPVVQIDTSAGAITIQLDGVQAPGTVRNFLNYASDGFYDDTLVHFVEPGKMIVAGGYSADRTPKPVARTPIRNEAHNGLKNRRGTIAMARDAQLIDSATSQFFINLADAPQRDHTGDQPSEYGYCVFGEVIEGLDVADKISNSATTNAGGDLIQVPEPAIIIKSVRVVR